MRGRRVFGTVRCLPSGRWQARRWDDGEGRQIAAPITFATKAEASKWLSSADTDIARGRFIDPIAGRVTLEQYARSWLSTRVNLAPRTLEIYRDQLERDILPALGKLPIASITSERVRTWYAELARNRSRSVAAKAYVRLRQMFNQAVEDDRVPRNPCRIAGGGTEWPAPELGPWEPLSLTDANDCFDAASFWLWVSGGRALELHLGRSWREHDDTDIGMVRRDVVALRSVLDSWDIQVAARGRLEPWEGQELRAEASQNNLWCRQHPHGP